MTPETHVWLRNPETGEAWRCPVSAVEAWKARGWTETDAPAEADPTDTRAVDGVEPDPEPEPAEDKPRKAAAKRTTSSRAAGSGESEE